MLRWMVELGRIDIRLEVSMMSYHLAMPRERHIAEGKEEIPSNMPEPRDIGFVMRAKVDADHA
eukprot:4149434-Ditylum_brightwellii.AAC.1